MIKAKELRELAPVALLEKIKDMEAGIFNLRIQSSMGKLENQSLLRTQRREIAIAKTVLNQKSSKAGA
jgi:ribosomal protein L29